MAKTCETCNQPYSEDLSQCPHCAEQAAREAGHGARGEEAILAAMEHKNPADDVIEIEWGTLEEAEAPEPKSEGPASADVLGETPASAESASGSALFAQEPGRAPVPTESYPTVGNAPPNVNVVADAHAKDDDESDVDLGERFDTGGGGLSTLDRMRMAKKVSKEWENPNAPQSAGEQLGETVLDKEAYRRPRSAEAESEVNLGSEPEGAVEEEPESFDMDALPEGAEGVAEFEEAPVEEGEEPLPESEFEVVDADEDAPAKPARPRASGVVAWVGGGAIGAVVAAAACVTLSVLGLMPGSSKKTTTVAAASTPSALAPQPISNPEPTPVAPDDPPYMYLDRGEFDRLLQKPAPANATPDILVARGEARWLAYLRQQKQKNDPVNADDPAVKQAKTDLEGAKSALGMYWLGQIQETTGDVAAARKTYEVGLTNFKNDSASQRMFQAAMDRIDAAESNAAGGNGEPGKKDGSPGTASNAPEPGQNLGMAVSALALLDYQDLVQVQNQVKPEAIPAPKPVDVAPAKPETVKPAASNPEQDEAGVEFWRAVKLAKDSKYEEASEALKKARALHDARRFLRLRKSQNPTSDPTESIFLRCCDELQAEWQVQALLQNSGYLTKPGRAEAVRAVAKLVSEGKDQKQAVETLNVLVAKLKKDKDAATEAGSQDAGQLVDRVLEAKGRAEAEGQAIRQLLEAAKYLTDDQKNLAQAVEKVIAEDKKLREGLASAAQLLKGEKYLNEGNADVAGAVEKLAEDKKTTETKLKAALAQLQTAENNVQEMEKRLTDVKSATLEERPDQGAKGVDLPGGPNPYVADDHYGAGIGLYWSGRYHDAEKEFALAIRYAGAYDQDARHFYYLGLSQFQEGNARAAAESMRRAVLLEQQNKPGSATINKALERVQGEPRRFLNTFRL